MEKFLISKSEFDQHFLLPVDAITWEQIAPELKRAHNEFLALLPYCTKPLRNDEAFTKSLKHFLLWRTWELFLKGGGTKSFWQLVPHIKLPSNELEAIQQSRKALANLERCLSGSSADQHYQHRF